MTKPLSKQAQANLLTAVDAICDGVANSGADAESLLQAAAKQAEDAGFGPDMIRLMCHGWNNGAVTSRRETSSGILQKTAAFPILDPEQVIQRVFGAAAKVATDDLDAAYLRPPRRPERPKVAESSGSSSREKTASADSELAFRRQYSAATRLNEEIKTARQAYKQSLQLLQHKVASIAEYFQRDRGREWLFDEVAYAAKSHLGSLAEPVMQAAADLNNYTVKSANLRPRRAIDWNSRPFCWVVDAVKLAPEVNAKYSEYISVGMTNRYKIAQLMDRVTASPPTPATTVFDRPDNTPFVEKLAFLSGGLSDVAVLGDLINEARGPAPTRDAMVGGALAALNDPAHDEKLRQIRARGMLFDLLNHDEILASYNPSEVLKAYNNLSTLAPRASQQPVIANSVLRRWATQGGVEPFEAKEINDLEKGLKQTQQVGRPLGGADKEATVLTKIPTSVLQSRR